MFLRLFSFSLCGFFYSVSFKFCPPFQFLHLLGCVLVCFCVLPHKCCQVSACFRQRYIFSVPVLLSLCLFFYVSSMESSMSSLTISRGRKQFGYERHV